MLRSLVGSEMCIRDRLTPTLDHLIRLTEWHGLVSCNSVKFLLVIIRPCCCTPFFKIFEQQVKSKVNLVFIQRFIVVYQYLKALRYDWYVTRGSHSFTCCPHTNHTCLYSPAARHHRPLTGTILYCLVTEAHRCEKLAQSFYAACRDSIPRPLDRKSDTRLDSATTPPIGDCRYGVHRTSNNRFSQ